METEKNGWPNKWPAARETLLIFENSKGQWHTIKSNYQIEMEAKTNKENE